MGRTPKRPAAQTDHALVHEPDPISLVRPEVPADERVHHDGEVGPALGQVGACGGQPRSALLARIMQGLFLERQFLESAYGADGGSNGAAFLTAGGARRAAGGGAVDPLRARLQTGNDSSDTESWISTSQLPISMVVPSTHVPALPLATILPVISKRVVVGCWLIAIPSTQDLLLRFFALLRLA